ncbi:hypothetical protein [Candidatus Coxiella mudrowiae]|nr:hypothetical protein [Candidatus Coxiella mudrowiae]
MRVGMFAPGQRPDNQSEVARTLFFKRAKKVIRISQQDIRYQTKKYVF